jgi:ubiquinone/menaquinone biosynthesis C-methylase UbiE
MDDFREIKRITRIYDKRASTYNSLNAAGQWISENLAKDIIKEIIQKIELINSDKVLEIGCGSGVLGSKIAEKCQYFVGFDTSRVMLNRFRDENKNVNLIQASATHIPLREDVFDKIIMNGVTMYFPNNNFLASVMNESKRVTKKKFLIFLGENIIPSKFHWELVWFENLPLPLQLFAKQYIKFRLLIARKKPSWAGKWRHIHKAISPKSVEYFFNNLSINITDAASYTIRKREFGKNAKGNRRVDFIIKS